jgi:pimeloyl-ACP methyl ester carboxylesterase
MADTPTGTTVPTPLRATPEDLPPLVAAAVADPAPPADLEIEADGRRWRLATWGDPADPPLVLVHGVTSNAESFWRVGPALAMTGRWVVAPDLPGHGRTGGWGGDHRLAATAASLATLLRVAKLDRRDLALLGHSWGAAIAAHLPAAGIRPRTLILLDPPTLPVAALRELTVDPLERPYPTVAEAEAAIRAANPGWSDGDIRAKALGLTQFNPDAVLAVLVGNGDWDGGLAALGDEAAAGIDAWLIRGEEATGALMLDAAVPAFAARLGCDHVITIADGPHSPQRTHPEATVLAILRALGGA